MRSAPILAFDFGGPVAEAALAAGAEVVAERREARDGEADLLRLLDELLRQAEVAPRDLGGVVALAGPGSFTGVRVACAAALGLGQAWDLPIAGVSTLAALAWSAPPAPPRLLAVVDALRGEWFVQPFGPADPAGRRAPLADARLWSPGEPAPRPAAAVVGHGAERFAAATGVDEPVHAAGGVAAAAALAAASPDWRWDAAALTRPYHLRAPATTRPRT